MLMRSQAILDRSFLVLLSVYLYNEYQGFTQLGLLLEAFKRKYPNNVEMIAAISKHAADEKKHYLLFRSYFQSKGQMPLRLGSAFGYVDLLVERIFRRPIETLDQVKLFDNEEAFFQLSRLIMMTESRGLKQVQWLLRTRWIQRNDRLYKLFRGIEADEPSHFLPYASWLKKHGAHHATWSEKLVELWVHISLVIFRIPLLFLKFWQPRLKAFPY